MRGYAIKGVGFIHVQKAPPKNITAIEGVVVNDEYQRCGVATAFFNLVIRDADIEEQELWMVSAVLDPNHWMNQWYERMGFEPHDGYYIRKPQPVVLPEGQNKERAKEAGMPGLEKLAGLEIEGVEF